MDSLRSGAGDGYRPGECYPPRGFHLQQLEEQGKEGSSHSHSNSDSGLSSLSGRTSCMSPLSVVSTVSSASSGSSRASLRSASIVSSSTIPLEEDDERELSPQRRSGWEEEEEIARLASDLFKMMPVEPNVSLLFGTSSSKIRTTAGYLKGVFNVEQLGSVVPKDQSNRGPCGVQPGSDEEQSLGSGGHGHVGLVAKKCELEGHIKRRLSWLKTEEAGMKERGKSNSEVGRDLLAKLRMEGTQTEVEKYSLHVEEVDKITSLILGLSSRLAKAENTLIHFKRGTWGEDEEAILIKKKEKLVLQLEEAKVLKSSIDRRSAIVSSLLLGYLGEVQHTQYKA